MKTFKKWDKRHIEDWSCYMSDDGKKFYRAFKNYLKRSFPGDEIIGFKPNHYDASGFIRRGDNYIYVSHSIDRYREWVDFSVSSCTGGVLYRTAENAKDYTGGGNHFTSINNMVEDIEGLFAMMERKRQSA